MSTNGKFTGKVKFFNKTKGFGFIERLGNSDVFVHAKDLPFGVTELSPDQDVAFTVEEGTKGPRAKNLELQQIRR